MYPVHVYALVGLYTSHGWTQLRIMISLFTVMSAAKDIHNHTIMHSLIHTGRSAIDKTSDRQ